MFALIDCRGDLYQSYPDLSQNCPVIDGKKPIVFLFATRESAETYLAYLKKQAALYVGDGGTFKLKVKRIVAGICDDPR